MDSRNDQFKAACTSAKSVVTGEVNELHDLIAVRESADVIHVAQVELKELLSAFKSAHEVYYQRLRNENEREESSQPLATELQREINKLITHPEAQKLPKCLCQP